MPRTGQPGQNHLVAPVHRYSLGTMTDVSSPRFSHRATLPPAAPGRAGADDGARLSTPAPPLSPQAARRADRSFRPMIHFTPVTGFMNDPNGLVFDGTRYHLYYQYNPFAPYAGHVHWGHATSPDLLHWTDQPMALGETEAGEAYTGCAVMDFHNTTGLFGTGQGGMVALYTRAGPHAQAQYLATSDDNGQTFREYARNPVLDIGSNSFRDPQVCFHGPSGRWIMVVAKSRLHQIAFHASIDLVHWVHLSDFGPSGLFGVDYECPNLIEMPVAGGGTRWVLFVSVNPGGPSGGSITQYFVGQFDGTRFIPDDTVIGLTDFAKDAYALQVYSNMPGAEAVSIAWLGNWQYAQELPTQSWRGVMTLPRAMVLKRDFAGRLRLAQTPRGLDSLRDVAIPFPAGRLAAGAQREVALPPGQAVDLCMNVTVDERSHGLPPGDGARTGRFIITFGNEGGERLTIGFDAFSGQLWLDRGGLAGFAQPFFTGQFSTVLDPDDRHCEIRIVLDACTLEIFANGGLAVGTALIFPASALEFLRLEARGTGAMIGSLTLHTLRRTMPRDTMAP